MDADGIAAMFTEDGEIVNGTTVIHRRDAIRDFLASFTDVHVDINTMTSQSITVEGATATQTGTDDQSVTYSDGRHQEVHNRFTAEWHRQPDGSWLIVRLSTTP